MREIKFRAWDGNRIREIFKIIFQQEGASVFFTDTNPPFEAGHLPMHDERLKLMQYTGLKDKNGKEIYEGDILQDTLTKIIYAVKFGNCKKYAFNGWYVENEYYDSRPINGDYDTNVNSKIEVIGNIYENPELLTT